MRICFVLLLCASVNSVSIKNSEPLIVTPLLNQGLHEEAQRQARVNYESFGNIESYSGYFQVEAESESNLFFWFFPAETSVTTNPVILCLNGGPGESSLLLLTLGNGPIIMNLDGTIGLRDHTWTKTNSILYIDNPVTVGYSVSNDQNPTSLAKITGHLLEALKQFFKMFPNLQNNNFYLMGESYGGKYVPSLANAIHTYNQNGVDVMNLKGVCIANGLTDTKYQTGYGDFLDTLGFINTETKTTIEGLEKKRADSVDSGDWPMVEEAFNDIFNVFMEKTGFQNIYNILEPVGDLAIYDSNLNTFFNRDDVKEALHVGTNKYVSYQYVVITDVYHPIPEMVENLLNNNYKVLIFTGQLDLIVSYVTVVNYLKRLSFPGSSNYLTAEKHIWRVEGTIAGYVKEVGNLYDVLVRDAGHYATMDQGKWVYDLVDRFVHNRDMWN